jgi:hypothetical protein
MSKTTASVVWLPEMVGGTKGGNDRCGFEEQLGPSHGG